MIVCKYKFDKSIYENLIPVFNDGYTGYTISDVIEGNIVTRTIECDTLPTVIRFSNGNPSGADYDGREKALLEILYLDNTNLTTESQMFQKCSNVTSITGFVSNVLHQINHMFCDCQNLTSLDVSNFDTSNVTSMAYMFNNCKNLTSLDLSKWDTSNVITMNSMFYGCRLLTTLDVSNWDTSNVTRMESMFQNCKNLTSLDVSNFNTSNVTDFTNIFTNTPLLTDIGMLYCTPSTINTIASNLPTTHTQTIWVLDADINKLTSVDGVEFKEYKENGVMINLSSPLLNGDRIEVKDGKLCHYHKMGMVVLDGSENWGLAILTAQLAGTDINTMMFNVLNKSLGIDINNNNNNRFSICNNFMLSQSLEPDEELILVGSKWWSLNPHTVIRIRRDKLSMQNINGFKQWLSENPTTVIYELAEPYYEDITPLQSDIVLETYLECNLDIYTKLPIKTNVSYITNVPSLSTLSMRATEMKESDNIIANLTNMLDNEINE